MHDAARLHTHRALTDACLDTATSLHLPDLYLSSGELPVLLSLRAGLTSSFFCDLAAVGASFSLELVRCRDSSSACVQGQPAAISDSDYWPIVHCPWQVMAHHAKR